MDGGTVGGGWMEGGVELAGEGGGQAGEREGERESYTDTGHTNLGVICKMLLLSFVYHSELVRVEKITDKGSLPIPHTLRP